MFRPIILLFVLCLAVLGCLLVAQGCTFHIKASELEASGYSDVTYELEKVDLFRDSASQ